MPALYFQKIRFFSPVILLGIVIGKGTLHSIFAVGAGSVTKLIKKDADGNLKIHRIFAPKYPYEYLRDADVMRNGDSRNQKMSVEEKISAFLD